MKGSLRSPINAKISELERLENGQRVIIEGYVSYIAPTKLDRLLSYIILDADSPIQRAMYLLLDSQYTTAYISDDEEHTIKVVDVPLGILYEGMRVRILGKLIKNRKTYVKFLKKL